ncbi:hypothetical protein DFR85_15475 [Acidianus brierleyi]|uniref:Uncharacterized protein n=2 Tax=Acidianus brierleyi TaxID=41673 RepID=A0A2U9IJH6_9CREN|nr:hypothetical protein DFR85_15475 [Acidianus brierleyi]
MHGKQVYLAIIISIIVILTIIYYPEINIIVQQNVTLPNFIKIFLYSNGKLITNGSITVFVFYPTEQGTVFKRIFNSSRQEYYQFPVKDLLNWAKNWLAYDTQHRTLIYPSIIVFASYSIKNETTIETLTQSFSTSLNISQIIRGIGGRDIQVIFNHPIIKYIKTKDLQQKIDVDTTTITTTITSTIRPGYETITLNPHILGWYPSNSSVGPISIGTIIGPTNITEYRASLFEEIINKVTSSENVGFYISQPLLKQLPVRVTLPGPSLTLYDTNDLVKSYNTTPIGSSTPYDVGQLYIIGQVAWVNWTEICYYPKFGIEHVNHFIQVIMTSVVAEENGDAFAPKIDSHCVYSICNSYNDLPRNSYSYSKSSVRIKGGGGGLGLIAPVYFNNLTNIGSSSNFQPFRYDTLNIIGVNNDYQIGVNVGALLSIAMPEASPELLATLGMVNIGVTWENSQLSLTQATVCADNSLITPLNVYYSNYSALYYINGQYYIIPDNVYYLNYS